MDNNTQTSAKLTPSERGVQRLRNQIRTSSKICQANKEEILNYDTINSNKGLSVKTSLAYLSSLRVFGEYMGDTLFRDATATRIDRFINKLNTGEYLTKKPSKATLNFHKTSVKQFYRKLYNCGEDEFPEQTKNIIVMRRKEGGIRTLQKQDLITTSDLNKMVKAATNQRDRAFIKVLWESGFRIGEHLSTKIKNVEIGENEIRLSPSQSKTRLRSVLIINAYPEMKEWLNLHPHKDNPEAYLWISNRRDENNIHKAMTSKNADYLVKKAAKAAGVNKRLFLHLFRHSRVTHMYHHGMNETELKMYFGWSPKSRTVYRYTHLALEDVDNKTRLISGFKYEKPLEEKVKRHEECQLCGHFNPAGYAICTECNSPLDPKKVIQMIREKSETETLLKQMKSVEPIIREIMKNGKLPAPQNPQEIQPGDPSALPEGGSLARS